MTKSFIADNKTITHSPWGKIDHCETVVNGIYMVYTNSHGGVYVCDAYLKIMPKHLNNGTNWYEEDCEILKVILAFPAFFVVDRKEIQDQYNFWFNADGTYKSRT